MKSTASRFALFTIGFLASFQVTAQEVNRILPPGYDPNFDKVIPDKVFELGIPLLILFVLANGIANIMKSRAENKLKEKALDRQLSEQAILLLFTEDKELKKYIYFKWFLILAAFGLSLVCIYLIYQFSSLKSGYLDVGIISLFMSLAFLIYYRKIQNK